MAFKMRSGKKTNFKDLGGYKGDFKQQPQFFATLSEDFMHQMHDECVVTK